MIVRGAVGSVRWGYHQAADVRQWVIRRAPDTKVWHLRGSVARADPFLGSRRELHFVAPLKGGHAWEWPITELRIANGVIEARLGTMTDPRSGSLTHG